MNRELQQELPPLHRLLESNDIKRVFRTREKKVILDCESLNSHFFCNLLFAGTPSKWAELKSQEHNQAAENLTSIPISTENWPLFIELYLNIYIDPFRKYFTDTEIKNNLSAFPSYLMTCHTALLYVRSMTPIGALLLSDYRPHPILGDERLHLGFVGYKRSEVSTGEAAWLKQEWIRTILNCPLSKIGLSASIGYFNQPSMNFARRLGLELEGVSIERRTSDIEHD